jgi:addiction module HigA family antidote
LLTIIEGDIVNRGKIPPLHPGVVLYEEFLQPLKISQNRIARDLAISPRRINEVVHGKRSVTADTALRLSIYFGNSAQFWLGLQMDYDLDTAEDQSLDRLRKEVTPSVADMMRG